MRLSISLGLSLLCCLTALTCGRQQLDEATATGSFGAAGARVGTGSAGATNVAGSAGSAGASASGSAGTTGAPGTTEMSFAGGHLFDVCLDSSGCASGLECYCALCSTPCTPGSCAGLATGATCPMAIPSTSACVITPGTDCVIRCSTDSDCSTLGATAVCTVGWCRRPLLVTTTDRHVLTCADRAASMKARLDPVVASADRSCMTDHDCVLAPLSNSCYGNGCEGAPVSASGAAVIAAELKTLSQECDAAFRAGCVGAGTVNCPLEVLPSCVAGSCQEIVPP